MQQHDADDEKIGGFKVESENAPDGVHKVMYISLADKH